MSPLDQQVGAYDCSAIGTRDHGGIISRADHDGWNITGSRTHSEDSLDEFLLANVADLACGGLWLRAPMLMSGAFFS
jgi:hypothetical protein